MKSALTACADTVRLLAADMVQRARSGHPGLPMGMAETAVTLWARFLKHAPSHPDWPDRDRFILSAGHGSALLYSLLHLSGYDLPLEELKRFRQWGSRTPGHPEVGLVPGVETTTGPLGQGLANGVGMALAERMLAARFNREGRRVVDHRTFVLAGDGDIMEGITGEAASLAGHLQLGKLTVIYDSNKITIDGGTDLTLSEDTAGRFRAMGWRVIEGVDGHDLESLERALGEALAEGDRPTLLVVESVIGRGCPNLAGTAAVHGAPLGEEELARAKEALGRPADRSFHIPPGAGRPLEEGAARGEGARRDWEERMALWRRSDPEGYENWRRLQAGELPPDIEERLPAFAPDPKGIPTRSASGKVLAALAPVLPGLVGGSADLGSSNKTLLPGEEDIGPGRFSGRNLHFGVREHAMGGILNGLALHGGFMPYAGTFLIFSDYMSPAIRMAALMRLPLTYVFTHDSIGVGEDGPTHQPVEQLASLRAVPNLRVIRPTDAGEVPRAWLAALRRREGPTALVLTRQAVPVLDRRELAPATELLRGGYILKDVPGPRAILIATGSEVALALAAADLLAGEGIPLRVVAMPCRELFAAQEQAYIDRVLPPGIEARLVIEAGSPLGWERWAGPAGRILGLERFGASAPCPEVFARLGFTPEKAAAAVREMLG